jgi:3-hydroxyisobutyrate dehydrogenase-like beta-hydroxyacid dehydrogenase
MSGMNVIGMIMVQEAKCGGFEAHVYDTRLAAAIQLLRVEIRRAANPEEILLQVEGVVADLVAHERALLTEDLSDE